VRGALPATSVVRTRPASGLPPYTRSLLFGEHRRTVCKLLKRECRLLRFSPVSGNSKSLLSLPFYQRIPRPFAMSTALASVAAPFAPPQSEPGSSPQSTYPTLAPSTHTPAQAERRSASATSRTTSPNAPVVLSEGAAKHKFTPDGKRSPNS